MRPMGLWHGSHYTGLVMRGACSRIQPTLGTSLSIFLCRRELFHFAMRFFKTHKALPHSEDNVKKRLHVSVCTDGAHLFVADARLVWDQRSQYVLFVHFCSSTSAVAFFSAHFIPYFCPGSKWKLLGHITFEMTNVPFPLCWWTLSYMCLCFSWQERVFLSVSNYIFTIIFVSEMMIKVTITKPFYCTSISLVWLFLISHIKRGNFPPGWEPEEVSLLFE